MKIVLVMVCLIGQVYLEELKVEQKSAKQMLGPGPGLMPAMPGAGPGLGGSNVYGAQPFGIQPFGTQGFRQAGQQSQLGQQPFVGFPGFGFGMQYEYGLCTVEPRGSGYNVRGTVRLRQAPATFYRSSPLEMIINVTGLNPNSNHGFHVHTYGDLSGNCDSSSSHYNPFNVQHGAPNDRPTRMYGGFGGFGSPNVKTRHVGDFGNIQADQFGQVNQVKIDYVAKIASSYNDPYNIMGRTLVIHAAQDDLGLGNTPDSLTTGNAGGRVACCVIGKGNPSSWPTNPINPVTNQFPGGFRPSTFPLTPTNPNPTNPATQNTNRNFFGQPFNPSPFGFPYTGGFAQPLGFTQPGMAISPQYFGANHGLQSMGFQPFPAAQGTNPLNPLNPNLAPSNTNTPTDTQQDQGGSSIILKKKK